MYSGLLGVRKASRASSSKPGNHAASLVALATRTGGRGIRFLALHGDQDGYIVFIVAMRQLNFNLDWRDPMTEVHQNRRNGLQKPLFFAGLAMIPVGVVLALLMARYGESLWIARVKVIALLVMMSAASAFALRFLYRDTFSRRNGALQAGDHLLVVLMCLLIAATAWFDTLWLRSKVIYASSVIVSRDGTVRRADSRYASGPEDAVSYLLLGHRTHRVIHNTEGAVEVLGLRFLYSIDRSALATILEGVDIKRAIYDAAWPVVVDLSRKPRTVRLEAIGQGETRQSILAKDGAICTSLVRALGTSHCAGLVVTTDRPHNGPSLEYAKLWDRDFTETEAIEEKNAKAAADLLGNEKGTLERRDELFQVVMENPIPSWHLYSLAERPQQFSVSQYTALKQKLLQQPDAAEALLRMLRRVNDWSMEENAAARTRALAEAFIGGIIRDVKERHLHLTNDEVERLVTRFLAEPVDRAWRREYFAADMLVVFRGALKEESQNKLLAVVEGGELRDALNLLKETAHPAHIRTRLIVRVLSEKEGKEFRRYFPEFYEDFSPSEKRSVIDLFLRKYQESDDWFKAAVWSIPEEEYTEAQRDALKKRTFEVGPTAAFLAMVERRQWFTPDEQANIFKNMMAGASQAVCDEVTFATSHNHVRRHRYAGLTREEFETLLKCLRK